MRIKHQYKLLRLEMPEDYKNQIKEMEKHGKRQDIP